MSGCGAGFLSRAGDDRPKVAVLNIKGGASVRDDVVVLLQERYEMVPKRTYVKTARSLKATKLRARHITKVSAELGLGAVVSGRVKRRGKRRYLYIKVHDGASGATIESFRVRLTQKRKLTKSSAAELESKLMSALAEVKPQKAERGGVYASGDDKGDDGDDDDDAAPDDKPAKSDKKLSKRERRRRAREERARKKAEERERERAEAEAERKAAADERERKKREREEREAKKREESARKKREAAVINKVANPKTDDSGQAIDDEEPPGF